MYIFEWFYNQQNSQASPKTVKVYGSKKCHFSSHHGCSSKRTGARIRVDNLDWTHTSYSQFHSQTSLLSVAVGQWDEGLTMNTIARHPTSVHIFIHVIGWTLWWSRYSTLMGGQAHSSPFPSLISPLLPFPAFTSPSPTLLSLTSHNQFSNDLPLP